jgi:TRAP-type C4-dicarboxylate transport system permease small subunit
MIFAVALLVIGGGHALIALATGKMPTRGFEPIRRDDQPRQFWTYTALFGFTGLVGLFGVIIKLLQ